MIILLVLLPALVLSEEVPKINITKCNWQENYCLCYYSPKLEMYPYYHDGRENFNCTKIALQNKFFNDNHVLFQIQVNLEEGEQLEDGATIEFYHGYVERKNLSFGCELEKGQVKLLETPENKDIIQKYKISLFEDRSIMKNNVVLCAIQSKRIKLILAGYNYGDTGVKLSWNNKLYISRFSERNLFKPQHTHTIKCDPYLFKDLPTSKEYIFHSLKNRDADVLNCDNYNANKDLFTMRYQKIDHPDEDYEIKQLKCVSKNDDYYYVPGKINPAHETKIVDMEEITDPESYYVYCAAHFDELCESPIKGCTATETTTCPEYITGKKAKPGKPRQPATLTCPDDKWLINKQYSKLKVYCMKNFMGNSNTAIFFAKRPSGRYIPVPEDAVCSQKYDCRWKSKLDLPKKETSFIDSLVDDSSGTLKCKNSDRTLAIYLPGKDEVINKNQSYSCNPETGSWENGMEIVPSKSIVRCIDVNAWPKLKQKLGIS